MGMTIDDCIDWLCRLRSEVLIFMPFTWHKKLTDALTMAIDTIRKYQKIKEIVRFGNANELGFEYIGEKITEVIEDDNSIVDNSNVRSNQSNTEHRPDSGTDKK